MIYDTIKTDLLNNIIYILFLVFILPKSPIFIFYWKMFESEHGSFVQIFIQLFL